MQNETILLVSPEMFEEMAAVMAKMAAAGYYRGKFESAATRRRGTGTEQVGVDIEDAIRFACAVSWSDWLPTARLYLGQANVSMMKE